jgi:hypothetical protein
MAVLLSGCRREPPPPPIPSSQYAIPAVPPTYVRPVGAGGGSGLRFSDVTAAAGMRFTHVTGAFGQKWMPETLGGGGGFFDFDGDRQPDVLLVNSDYWPGHEAADPAPTSRLFRNRGDGTFEDISERCGLSALRCYGMGASMADYDGDGDEDVYITAVGKNHLLRNDAGRLTDVTDRAGVGFSGGPASAWEWSLGSVWLDYDRDGDLDLFVCNYVQWTPETDIWTTRDGKTKSYATPERYRGASCTLFRNGGDDAFLDVTRPAGLFNPEGKSMSVAVDDFNDDGWPDLFVTNDTQPNFLYVNGGDGTFQDRALQYGVAYDENGLTRAGMGVDTGSLTNAPARTIAIGNFSGEPVSLYTQEGPGAFIDKAGATRLARPTTLPLTFGLAFADLNLDGYEDLILANGHIEPHIESVRDGWQFEQAPQLFLNTGRGQFAEITEQAGPPFQERIVGRGVACADVDRDGDLDVLLTVNGGAPKLLRNDFGSAAATGDAPERMRPVVRVCLHAADRNRRGIGARLRAHAGNAVQTRFIRTGGSYLSQSEPVATFGLAGAREVSRLEVRWPDGREERFEHIEAGQCVTIEQGKGVTLREKVELAAR